MMRKFAFKQLLLLLETSMLCIHLYCQIHQVKGVQIFIKDKGKEMFQEVLIGLYFFKLGSKFKLD